MLPTSMNPTPLEHMRLVLYVQKAALRFLQGIGSAEAPKPSPEVAQAGYRIDPAELSCMVRSNDIEILELHGGVEGIAQKLSVLLDNGVYTSSIVRRNKTFGVNQFIEKPARPFLLFLWDALQDATLIILIVCAVASVAVGIATEGWPKGMYDGLGIILCISLVVIVTAISDYKQSLQFKDINREKVNMQVHVTRNACRQKISIFEVVVGDVVHLSIGDQVPADGLFISGYSLAVDESSLSGESEPVNKSNERPFLLSGTKVQDGSGKMLVTSVGMSTEWGKLMATLTEGGEDETPLQVKLNGVATIIGKIGLSFAVLTFFVLTARFLITKGIHGEITKWTMNDGFTLLNFFAIAVTILVVAVPEGLPLAVTLSLAFAMKKLMNERALVRHLSACETMGSASCICTDKTGTLTTNHMVVRKIWMCGERKTVEEQNSLEKTLKPCISEAAIFVLLQSIFKNTSAEIVRGDDGKENVLGSPTETALLELGSLLRSNHAARLKEMKILKVEPFNSNKKKMSVFVSLPEGRVRAFCKGASELILEMCNKMLDKDGKSVPLSEEQRNYLKDVIDRFASESLRTLCLAFNDDSMSADTFPDNNYSLIAIIAIKDPLRRGVKESVRTCLDAGITVRMVTGDNIMTAKSIARECGIYTAEGIAMEGDEFRNKSNEELKEIIPKLQVLARSMPLDKHKLVNLLREEFQDVVAVTGDGTNDAPALHEADIGLAMGIAGTEVAKESADVVILDDNFSTIVNLAKWGRSVYVNIQKFVQFQLTVNVVALMANFVLACVSGSAPLTTVQLLWVNMIMDTLGALALATEPPHDGLMKQPPIGRNVGFITKIMWRNIIGQSIYQLAILGVLEFQGKRLFNLNGSDSASILNTLIFNTFVFCQVFNEINSRDMEKINVFRGIFQSWIFMIVIVSTVAFQVIIVEFLGALADTVTLSWRLWLASVLMGAGSLPVAVVLKCIPVSLEKKKPIRNVKQQHDGYEPLPTGSDAV